MMLSLDRLCVCVFETMERGHDVCCIVYHCMPLFISYAMEGGTGLMMLSLDKLCICLRLSLRLKEAEWNGTQHFGKS